MYGKVFESIYEGTLYGQWEAIVTMQQMIVLANESGVVDMTPPAIAGKTSIPLEIIEKGLKILSEPDPYSRTPGNDGVRIKLIDDHKPWGWFIVNHEKYQKMVRRADKREADRVRIANKRNALKNNDVAKCRTESQHVANVAHEDEDEDIDENKTTTAAKRPTQDATEFIEFKSIYPKRSGGQPWSRAKKAISARLKAGDSWDDILAGTRRYAAYCRATDKIGTEFVMQAATFCGPERHFTEPWNPPEEKRRSNQATDPYFDELRRATQ